MTTRYLVTAALPYANGAIHLGHLVEHVQVNVFVRALRMAGEDVLYVCGADSHGTPIEINAQKAKMTPEKFVRFWQKKHEASFQKFDIEFDGGYGTTHSKENEFQAKKFFESLRSVGHIVVRDVEQLYDESEGRFLSDRMVRGTCPACKTPDQYGDSCEECGSTYRPTDLKDPKSALSKTTPILKSSKHYFFELRSYANQLKSWLANSYAVSKDVRNYLDRWFDSGLRDWDISRDGPYFGFRIPGEKNKYFYVWLDAPIGYISLTSLAAQKIGRSVEDYWRSNETKIFHFIGKDIIYFHTLFWPAMLMAASYTLPTKIPVHGMLTVNGEKMSKSRGTFILADTFVEYLDPQCLRYYLACKINDRIEDIDLNFADLVARVDSDLVNKIVNILSRSMPLLNRFCGGRLALLEHENEFVQAVKKIGVGIEQKYRRHDTAQVVRDVVSIAENTNRFLQERAPWKKVKEDQIRAKEDLTAALWAGKVCIGLLKPICPDMAERMQNMLRIGDITFSNVFDFFTVGHEIGKYERLFERMDLKKVEAMIQSAKAEQQQTGLETTTKSEPPNHIPIDDFMKIELCAARVIEAKSVEGADKLISLTLDVGPHGQRHVFAGLKPHVQPEELIHKTLILVLNLKPRKMRFGTSEGMVLSCGDKIPVPVFLENVSPGDRVR